MNCRKCGAEISDDAEFCPVCRSSVTVGEEPASAPPPIPEPEPPAPLESFTAESEDYSAGEAQPVYTEEKKPAGKKKLNLAASVVIAIVFGFLAMTFAQTATAFCTVSGALSSHAISEQIADIDISSIKIGSLLPDDIKDGLSAEAGKITDDIAGIVSKISDGAMNNDQAAEIIRRANINKEIAKIIRAYEDYIMSGKSDIDISEQLQQAIIGAKQVYKDVTGKDAPASFDSDVIGTIKDNAEQLEKLTPQAALGMVADTLRVVFSPAVWIVLFVISAMFPLLVWAITKRGTVALMCGGAAYLVSGVGLLISNAMTALVKNIRFDELGDVVSQVLSNALDGRLMVCGTVMTVVGAALVVAFIVVKVAAAKRSKAA